jgi:hypothetical protein
MLPLCVEAGTSRGFSGRNQNGRKGIGREGESDKCEPWRNLAEQPQKYLGETAGEWSLWVTDREWDP